MQHKTRIQKIIVDKCVLHYNFNIYFIETKKKNFKFFLMQYMQTSNMEASHKRLFWKLFSWKLFVKAYKLVMVKISNSIAC
jgi:hypothetical protein